MSMRKLLTTMIVLLSAPCSFAAPAPIEKTCNSPDEVMTPEQFQNAVSDLIKNRVIEYQIQSQRLMLKEPSALEQLKRSNRVDEMCALAHVVCW